MAATTTSEVRRLSINVANVAVKTEIVNKFGRIGTFWTRVDPQDHEKNRVLAGRNRAAEKTRVLEKNRGEVTSERIYRCRRALGTWSFTR